MEGFRLPVVRLHIGEVRGLVLITDHQHVSHLRDNQGQRLPGSVEAALRSQVAVWVWSREVWYGGPVDDLQEPGPHLNVSAGQGCWEISWGSTEGFEFKQVALLKEVDAFEQCYAGFQSASVRDTVALLQELVSQLSVYDAQGLGLLLISLPVGFRYVLDEDPIALRVYSEGKTHFPEDT
jgi:hypothetical protein